MSKGCQFCYAEELMDTRYGKVQWGPDKPRSRTSESNWKKPLKWNAWVEKGLCGGCGHTREDHNNDPVDQPCGCVGAKGKKVCECVIFVEKPRVFCASLSDWLDNEVPIEWLADLLALIAATPNLTWLLLSKRPQLFEERVGKVAMADPAPGRMSISTSWIAGSAPKNVWVGTTVEDQKRANERVPALIKTPAVVRFLSCEPLLGYVDLGRWIGDYNCHYCNERFWGDDLRDGHLVSVDYHDTGPETDALEVCPYCNYQSEDTGDGTIGEVSSDEDVPPIGWLIVGGESGKHARPMHPAWAGSLKDQSRNGGVPFHFKQWGEWRPMEFEDIGESHTVHVFPEDPNEPEVGQAVVRVGKHRAGRVLDGKTWDELPGGEK